MKKFLLRTLGIGLVLAVGLFGYRLWTDRSASAYSSGNDVPNSSQISKQAGGDETISSAGKEPAASYSAVTKSGSSQRSADVVISPDSRLKPIDPSQILEKRITDLPDGRKKRELLVQSGGKYPYRRIEEVLVQNEDDTWDIDTRKEMVADHVLVKLQDGQTKEDLETLLQQSGNSILRELTLPGHYIISLKQPTLDAVPDAVEAFSQESDLLAYAEPNYFSRIQQVPNDSSWAELWGMVNINATGAWDTVTGSTNVTVAVIDSGIDLDHPDLEANLWKNTAEVNGTEGVDDDGNGYIDDIYGWDFGRNDSNPDDNADTDYDGNIGAFGYGHGTHCAGIIGAVGNNGQGVVGVCWSVRMMALKAGSYSASYDSILLSGAIDATVYAADNGANIISASYGGTEFSQTELAAIEYADSKGVLFVAGAGNGGSDQVGDDNDAALFYPASYDVPNIVSVAASDENDQLAGFSNYGKTSVDLAAPGVDILSTVPGGLYGLKSGTSMATPYVAGAAALLLSTDSTLTHLQLKQALLATVDPIPELISKTVSGGRLNVLSMIKLEDSDEDGMPDDWEIENGLGPTNPNDAESDPLTPITDRDADHLSNLGEYENRCDPNDADTDDDSLVDGWEVKYGFNPNTPAGSLSLSSSLGRFSTLGSANAVFVGGDYAYLAVGTSGLQVADISNPENPVSLGSCSTSGEALDVAVSNGYAYVANGSAGLAVVDVSNPSSPELIRRYNTPGEAVGIEVQGQYVYLADGSNELLVFNISDPSSPELQNWALNYLRAVNDVFIQSSSVYVAADANVYKLDISNPASPEWVTAAPFTQQEAFGVHGNATLIAAAKGEDGISILDTDLTIRNSYVTGDTANDVFVRDSYVYIADGTNGLVVLDATNPSALVEAVHLETEGDAVNVFIDEGYAYVTEGSAGMEIFSVLSDSDEDGLLDSWEVEHFGGLAQDGTGDYDSDGISDWGEYLADLDPLDNDQDNDGLIDGTQEIIIYNSDPRDADTDDDGLDDGVEVDLGTDPILADTDGDGMSDGWENTYGFNPSNVLDPGPTDDADNDDLNNLEESEAETDPTDSDTDNDGMDDGWEVDNLLDPLTDDSALDPDEDDLTNLEEYTLTTDPQNSDSDGDGMDDGWEVDNLLDPLTDDAADDADGDGLSNLGEYQNQTEPQVSDTDNDGMPDGWEVENYLDPLTDNATADPDADGLQNIHEYNLVSNSLWQAVYSDISGTVSNFSFGMPGSTNPNEKDSDGDGLDDLYEITTNGVSNTYITNPNSIDTDNDGLSDSWELAQDPVSDPTDPSDEDDDSDNDGLKNFEEEALGTDPANANDPIFVDDDGPYDDDDGRKNPEDSDPAEDGSKEHPFDAIQDAINAAVDGTTVLINDGWYSGVGNIAIDLQGKELTIRSLNGKNVTTISTLGVNSAFLFTGGESTNTVLQGLTIKGALCESSDGDCDWIDIIRIQNSSPIIRDCTIQDTGGNAVFCSGDSSPQFIDCVVANARNGFWCEGGAAPVITGSLIQNIRLYDTVFPLDEYWGNGIYSVQGGALQIRSTTIENCDGRGMYLSSASGVTIEDSTVRNSWGGIRFSGVGAELIRCRIQNNEAPNYFQVANTVTKRQMPVPGGEDIADFTHENENGAGILLMDGSIVSMENVLLSGNRTWAVDPNFPLQDEVSIDTPELWGPDYGLGGGMYVGAGCEVVAVNATIADNTAMTRGGGISNHEDSSLNNVISWGNFAYGMHVEEDGLTDYSVDEPKYYEFHCRSGMFFVRNGSLWYPYYSDDEVYDLEIIILEDPQFVSNGDYRLQETSPCIDIGTSSLAPTNDLDGILRPIDGDEDGITRVDIGCYEFIPYSFDSDGDGVADTDEILQGTDWNNADTDNDGSSDGDEAVAGTDPLSDSSFFCVNCLGSNPSADIVIEWDSVSGRLYTVQTTESLTGSWSDITGYTDLSGTGGTMTFQDVPVEPTSYYRVLVEQP